MGDLNNDELRDRVGKGVDLVDDVGKLLPVSTLPAELRDAGIGIVASPVITARDTRTDVQEANTVS